MVNFVNLTGHNINFKDQILACNQVLVARVKDNFGEFDDDGICSVSYGKITGLPASVEGTYYIVSALVLIVAKAAGRTDCVAPATGHSATVKNEKGHILSVPGFVR
jgi:hypothetical protein